MQKSIFQISLKTFLWLKKLKILYCYVITGLNGKEIVGTFYKNELQKINQKECRVEKVIKKKSHKVHVEWKDCNNSFNSWMDKKRHSINFPKPKSFAGRVKVELYLSNYAT